MMTNNNSTLVSGLQLAAIALTLTGTSFAGDLSPGTLEYNAANVNSADGLSLEEFTTTLDEGTTAPKAARAFKKADTNKSGFVELQEFLISIGEIQPPTKEELSFIVADEDENGAISIAEFAETFTGKTAWIEIRKRFLKADADTTGTAGLSLEEWTLYKKGKAKGPEGAKYYKFDLADVDDNDELTIEEFALTFPKGTKEETIVKKFEKEDSSDNGRLTRDEWNPGAPKQSAAL